MPGVGVVTAAATDGTGLRADGAMGAGHGGPSGRYDAWKEEALVYAFLLDTLT